MLSLKNVSKDYIDGKNVTHALKNVSLNIENGKITVISGKSGSGKTTLLNMIGAIDEPTSGEIYNDDTCVTGMNSKERDYYRNRKIGYVFQLFYLEPNFTVLENVMVPLVISGIPKAERVDKATKIIEKLDLKEKINDKAANLSGGQKQRVAIARAIVNDPDIILADEPTGSLDSENGHAILEILKSLATDGKAVVLVTHNLEDAMAYGDIIYHIKDGKIVYEK